MARSERDFRGASSLSTLLYTIARSFCIKKRRRSKFAPQEEQEQSLDTDAAVEVSRLAAPDQDPAETLAGKQVEHALEQAIAALDPMYREVLLLRDVEGLTAPEVAEVIGVSVQAVKSRLHRARLSVRERVAPLLGVEPAQPASSACPDVLMVFSQHLEDEISAERCTEMERHLEGCARCRGTCDSLKRTLALCRTAGPSVPVPPSVQASVRTALRGFLAENA
jgi:RNA polymerase sigma-70 factor (ECF subfamily)